MISKTQSLLKPKRFYSWRERYHIGTSARHTAGQPGSCQSNSEDQAGPACRPTGRQATTRGKSQRHQQRVTPSAQGRGLVRDEACTQGNRWQSRQEILWNQSAQRKEGGNSNKGSVYIWWNNFSPPQTPVHVSGKKIKMRSHESSMQPYVSCLTLDTRGGKFLLGRKMTDSPKSWESRSKTTEGKRGSVRMGREPRCPWCKPEDPIWKCRKEEKLSKSGWKRIEAIALEPLFKMESLVLKIPTKENTRLRLELPCTNS